MRKRLHATRQHRAGGRRRAQRFLAALGLLCGGLTLSTPASAYVPSTTNVSGKPLRWTGSNCVFIQVNTRGSDDISDGSDVAAVLSSINRWHDVVSSCSYMRFNAVEGSADAVADFQNGGENINTVNFVESGWKTLRDHDPAAAGLTTIHFVDDRESSRDGKIIDADIELNGEFFEFTAEAGGVQGKTDIENTVVHELGHVLGLDHPCDDGLRTPIPKDHLGNTIPKCFPAGALTQELRDRTMFNFADPAEVKKRTPEADDILGVCETYPLADNPGVCAPSNVGGSSGCALTAVTAPLGGERPTLPFTLLALFGAAVLGVVFRRR